MTRVRMTIDRIEGPVAVLLGESGERMTLSASVLPAGAVEGSIIDISLGMNVPATEQAKRETQDLMDRLSGEDG